MEAGFVRLENELQAMRSEIRRWLPQIRPPLGIDEQMLTHNTDADESRWEIGTGIGGRWHLPHCC